MSAMGTVYFSICAVIALLSAAGTVGSQTPIRAALSLLAHIISLAGLYLALHAHLLAALQLIVYAGAVVVLFVFVIMLIGPVGEPQRPLASGAIARVLSLCVMAGVAVSIAAAVGGVMPEMPIVEECPQGQPECGQFGGVRAVARMLYRDAVVPFELTSILLLVAILGAIAVARGRTIHEGKRAKREREIAAQVPASSGQ